MLIYLLRHGDAEFGSDIPDHDRPLTELGIQQASFVGKHLQHNKMQIEVLLVSPMLRAQQTAAVLQNYIGKKYMITTDLLLNGSNLEIFLEYIYKLYKKSIMLIGHIPHLENTLSLLTGVDKNEIELKKCSLAIVDIPEPIVQNKGKLLKLIHVNHTS